MNRGERNSRHVPDGGAELVFDEPLLASSATRAENYEVLPEGRIEAIEIDIATKLAGRLESVLAEEGDDPRIRYDLAVSHFRYGLIMEELGSPLEALQPLHRARRGARSRLDELSRESRGPRRLLAHPLCKSLPSG